MWMHANGKVYDAVSKTAAITFNYIHLTQKRHHPIQLKSVWKNEANRYSFALTLWHQVKIKVTDSGIKWKKPMAPISMACMKDFEKDAWALCSSWSFCYARLLAGRTTTGRPETKTKSTWFQHEIKRKYWLCLSRPPDEAPVNSYFLSQ